MLQHDMLLIYTFFFIFHFSFFFFFPALDIPLYSFISILCCINFVRLALGISARIRLFPRNNFGGELPSCVRAGHLLASQWKPES